MSPRVKEAAKRHGVSITAIMGALVAVLFALQQAAATRESYLKLHNAEQTITAQRKVIADCRKHHRKNKRGLLGRITHAAGSPLRWLTGGKP